MERRKGFTIVELLIVIVVIAILAAIVIVAYNGVQKRAKDTQSKSDAASLLKGAEIVNAETSAYPTGTDSATLTTSFNSTATFKIPTGLAISRVTAAPAYTTIQPAADAATRTYSVWTCTAGANIYYPQRIDSTVQVLKASAGC